MPFVLDIGASPLMGLGQNAPAFGRNMRKEKLSNADIEKMLNEPYMPQQSASPPPPPPPKEYKGSFNVTPKDWDALNGIQPMIDRAAKQGGWNPDWLAAQSMVESRAGRNAKTNSLGTVGIFQIRPHAVEPQFSKNNEIPDTNALHAAKMNKWIFDNKGHGDTIATLAKYNAGPYSGKDVNKYALDIQDIVKQIRSRRAIAQYKQPQTQGSKNIANVKSSARDKSNLE